MPGPLDTGRGTHAKPSDDTIQPELLKETNVALPNEPVAPIREIEQMEEIALVEVNIRLKGMNFSLPEADALARELVKNGFEQHQASPVLFETKVVIRDKVFTREELVTIVTTLREAGIGK